ncbi:hypothetical protein [Zobellella sp. DQSA1]
MCATTGYDWLLIDGEHAPTRCPRYWSSCRWLCPTRCRRWCARSMAIRP